MTNKRATIDLDAFLWLPVLLAGVLFLLAAWGCSPVTAEAEPKPFRYKVRLHTGGNDGRTWLVDDWSTTEASPLIKLYLRDSPPVLVSGNVTIEEATDQ